MKRSSDQDLPPRTRRRTTRTILEFRVDVETVDNVPHILTVRPTRLENAEPNQIAAAIVKLLIDKAIERIRVYNRRLQRSERNRLRLTRQNILNNISVILNGIKNY
jgi:hypothetical protein